MTKCKVVLLFSGKRKSGKDHITELLASRLGEQATVIRLVEKVSGQCIAMFVMIYEVSKMAPEINKMVPGRNPQRQENGLLQMMPV